MKLKTLTVIFCISVVAGCSFSDQIAQHAVAYNKSVARSENEMLLLNIIRASKQRPMYFTRVSELSGAFEGNLSTSLEVPFGQDAMEKFTSMFSLSGASKPTYSVEVLDSKEFYNGFLKPIDLDTFALFVASGWPMRTLVNALVEEAEVYVEEVPPLSEDMPSNTCKIISDHDNTERRGALSYYTQHMMEFVSKILSRSRSLDEQTVERNFGRALPLASVSDIAAIAELKEANLVPTLVKTKDGKVKAGAEDQIQLVTSSKTVSFASRDALVDEGFLERAKKALKQPPDGFCGDDLAKIKYIEEAANNRDLAGFKFVADLTLRSARGVLYALGEMVALRSAGDAKALSEIDPDRLGYFHVQSGGLPPASAISTYFNGEPYWIPTDEIPPHEIGRETRRLLALAQQVFSLNSSAEDAPTTQTIRFIQ